MTVKDLIEGIDDYKTAAQAIKLINEYKWPDVPTAINILEYIREEAEQKVKRAIKDLAAN